MELALLSIVHEVWAEVETVVILFFCFPKEREADLDGCGCYGVPFFFLFVILGTYVYAEKT